MSAFILRAEGRLTAIAESLRPLSPLLVRDLLHFDMPTFEAIAPHILRSMPELTPASLCEVVIEVAAP
jgi:hypothetical protein